MVNAPIHITSSEMPEKEHLCSLAVINSDLLGTEPQICAPTGLQTLTVQRN